MCYSPRYKAANIRRQPGDKCWIWIQIGFSGKSVLRRATINRIELERNKMFYNVEIQTRAKNKRVVIVPSVFLRRKDAIRYMRAIQELVAMKPELLTSAMQHRIAFFESLCSR